MLTLFALPKPFKGHTGIIQDNAVRNWRALGDDIQIILLGDDDGVEQAAQDSKADWIPNVAKNEFGTPLLDSTFQLACKHARYDMVCYLNADILLTKDLCKAIPSISGRRRLTVGQRWDVDISESIDFEGDHWEDGVMDRVERSGKLHGPAGIDYFIFHRRSRIAEIPPFAVGRPGWDNWMIFRARQLCYRVIDATDSIRIVHQNHDYGHIPKGDGKTYLGPEAAKNFDLVDRQRTNLSLQDTTHELVNHTLVPKKSKADKKRRIAIAGDLWPWTRPFISLGVRLKKLFHAFPAGPGSRLMKGLDENE